jgi:outer membrane protein assembly factor BamD (BamD/ComL family)
LGSHNHALADYEATRRELAGSAASGVQPASFEEAEPQPDPLTAKDFAPDNLMKTMKRLTGNGPNPALAQELYADAEARHQRALERRATSADEAINEFVAAAESYRRAADRWPDSTLEHEALFKAGECAFFADRYPEAEGAYELLLKKHPHSKYMDLIQPRRFRIAQYWLGLDAADHQAFAEVNLTDEGRPLHDTFGHAIRVFDRIRLDDPTGKLADDATLELGNAFFRRGDFLRSDEYYTDLRKTFPSSEHQFRAHFLGLKAKLLSYQGPDYAANALNDAEKLFQQLRRQFPMEFEQEREFLTKAGAEIRYRQAEREWHLGERYDRRAEYGAARFHYLALVQDFAETPFAQRAEQRLRDLGGLPDTPPQRLSWLVSLFPERDTLRPLVASDPTVRRR